MIESLPVSVHTFESPSDLELQDITNTSIHLMWRSPSDNATRLVSINYAQVTTAEIAFILFSSHPTVCFVLNHWNKLRRII